MSSVQSLREFISERLTAAAEEICTHFEGTIVQFEAELSRQRRLLDIVLKPQILPQTTVLPEYYLRNQERKSSEDQEEAELPQIKEQEDEISISQEEDQLGLKQEDDIVMVTPLYEENELIEEDFNNQQLQTQSFIDGQDEEEEEEEEDQQEASTSTTDGEIEPQNSRSDRLGRNIKVEDSPHMLTSPCDPRFEMMAENADIFGKTFKKRILLKKQKTKTFFCKLCGKSLTTAKSLRRHITIHTGERPFFCIQCHKSFSHSSYLRSHMRTHSGARPFPCGVCGKTFTRRSHLNRHTIIHTGEKPFSCHVCFQSFSRREHLTGHVRKHAGTEDDISR
uniref:C2H2-type domain-containing protein n=2 Tax=Oryzias latipes TaxID=8090 RepID=A0A3P9MP30_ORYLA